MTTAEIGIGSPFALLFFATDVRSSLPPSSSRPPPQPPASVIQEPEERTTIGLPGSNDHETSNPFPSWTSAGAAEPFILREKKQCLRDERVEDRERHHEDQNARGQDRAR